MRVESILRGWWLCLLAATVVGGECDGVIRHRSFAAADAPAPIGEVLGVKTTLSKSLGYHCTTVYLYWFVQLSRVMRPLN